MILCSNNILVSERDVDEGPHVNREKKVHDSDMETSLYSKYKVINNK